MWNLLAQTAAERPQGTLLCHLWTPLLLPVLSLQQPFQVAQTQAEEAFWAADAGFCSILDTLWGALTGIFAAPD